MLCWCLRSVQMGSSVLSMPVWLPSHGSNVHVLLLDNCCRRATSGKDQLMILCWSMAETCINELGHAPSWGLICQITKKDIQIPAHLWPGVNCPWRSLVLACITCCWPVLIALFAMLHKFVPATFSANEWETKNPRCTASAVSLLHAMFGKSGYSSSRWRTNFLLTLFIRSLGFWSHV